MTVGRRFCYRVQTKTFYINGECSVAYVYLVRERTREKQRKKEKRGRKRESPVDIGLWLVWRCLMSLCVFHFKLRLLHFHHLTRDSQIFKAQGLDTN